MLPRHRSVSLVIFCVDQAIGVRSVVNSLPAVAMAFSSGVDLGDDHDIGPDTAIRCVHPPAEAAAQSHEKTTRPRPTTTTEVRNPISSHYSPALL